MRRIQKYSTIIKDFQDRKKAPEMCYHLYQQFYPSPRSDIFLLFSILFNENFDLSPYHYYKIFIDENDSKFDQGTVVKMLIWLESMDHYRTFIPNDTKEAFSAKVAFDFIRYGSRGGIKNDNFYKYLQQTLHNSFFLRFFDNYLTICINDTSRNTNNTDSNPDTDDTDFKQSFFDFRNLIPVIEQEKPKNESDETFKQVILLLKALYGDINSIHDLLYNPSDINERDDQDEPSKLFYNNLWTCLYSYLVTDHSKFQKQELDELTIRNELEYFLVQLFQKRLNLVTTNMPRMEYYQRILVQWTDKDQWYHPGAKIDKMGEREKVKLNHIDLFTHLAFISTTIKELKPEEIKSVIYLYLQELLINEANKIIAHYLITFYEKTKELKNTGDRIFKPEQIRVDISYIINSSLKSDEYDIDEIQKEINSEIIRLLHKANRADVKDWEKWKNDDTNNQERQKQNRKKDIDKIYNHAQHLCIGSNDDPNKPIKEISKIFKSHNDLRAIKKEKTSSQSKSLGKAPSLQRAKSSFDNEQVDTFRNKEYNLWEKISDLAKILEGDVELSEKKKKIEETFNATIKWEASKKCARPQLKQDVYTSIIIKLSSMYEDVLKEEFDQNQSNL